MKSSIIPIRLNSLRFSEAEIGAEAIHNILKTLDMDKLVKKLEKDYESWLD